MEGEKTFVWVTADFEGYHRWFCAPDEVSFLRDWHRHLFKVIVTVEVGHGDREVEFFRYKRRLVDYLLENFDGERFEFSCEQIAEMICEAMDAYSVDVSEDGENGATFVKGTGSELESEKKKTRCFVGLEAEGPWRGRGTLFVPGSVGPEEAQRALDEVPCVAAIYYGAGNDRELRKDTFDWACFSGKKVIVECDRDWGWHIKVVSDKVVIVAVVDGVKSSEWRKYDTGDFFVWSNREAKQYKTPIDDWLFSMDRYVGEK